MPQEEPRSGLPQGARIELLASDLAHLEEMIELRLNKEEEARNKQAAEYERRLAELNHAHAEARAKEAEFVSRTEFNASYKELAHSQKLNADILLKTDGYQGNFQELFAFRDDMLRWRAKILGIHIGIAAMSGIMGGAFAALVNHWVK